MFRKIVILWKSYYSHYFFNSFIIIFSFSTLFCKCAYGQSLENIAYDVEGIKIGQVLNYSQFVAKFGLPDKYEKQSSNGGDYEVTETYKKGKCYFEFCNGGYFCGFTLSDNSFSALTFLIKGAF